MHIHDVYTYISCGAKCGERALWMQQENRGCWANLVQLPAETRENPLSSLSGQQIASIPQPASLHTSTKTTKRGETAPIGRRMKYIFFVEGGGGGGGGGGCCCSIAYCPN